MKYLPNISKKRIITSSFVLSIPLIATFVYTAHAQSLVRTFTIVPPTVQVALNPGQKGLSGQLKVINDSNDPLSFTTDIQDYIVNNDSGNPEFLPPGTLSGKYSAANWLGVTPDHFTIPPHQMQQLQYFIQSPKDAGPGGHYAAVMYTPVNTATLKRTGAGVSTKAGTLFYIDTAGPIKELAQVTRFISNNFQEYGPVVLTTQIKNLGDLHIRPSGSITLTNMFGKKVGIVSLVPTNIFPGVSRSFQNSLGNHLMIGEYKADLLAYYGRKNDKILTASVSVFLFPWKIAIVILLVLIAFILAIFLRRKKQDTGKPDETHAETGLEKENTSKETTG